MTASARSARSLTRNGLPFSVGFSPFCAAPHFIANRIVNNADNDFARETQRDRDAEMRNAVEIIHGAIERIDDPLVFAGLVAHDSFLAVKRMLGKFFQKQLGDQLLCRERRSRA